MENSNLFPIIAALAGKGGSANPIQVEEMPVASASNEGRIVQFIGDTTSSYTNGYFYQSTASTEYTATPTFASAKISCGAADFLAFIKVHAEDTFMTITGGSMKYYTAADLWVFTATDEDGETVFTYQQYTDDFEEEGFTFTGDFEDEETITFTVAMTANTTYSWVRINVQPAGAGGDVQWGDITGSLEDQSDLSTALAAKASVSNTYTKTEVDTALSAKANAANSALTGTATAENITVSGDLTVDSVDVETSITVPTPSDNTDAANKGYVDTAVSGKQNTLTAGSNISISGDTISATDTTYNPFTGTDGSTAGTAGLVPAPATTDAGKFLKADGTWGEAGGGSGPTVVQTMGTSTTDVMSQDATTKLLYDDNDTYKLKSAAIKTSSAAISKNGYVCLCGGSNQTNVNPGNCSVTVTCPIGGISALATGQEAIMIGSGSMDSTGERCIAMGFNAGCYSKSGLAIGYTSQVPNNCEGAVAMGSGSYASTPGEFNIGTSRLSSKGYNGSDYRLLSGLYDGQTAHDAATVGQLNALIDAINTAANTNIPHIGS